MVSQRYHGYIIISSVIVLGLITFFYTYHSSQRSVQAKELIRDRLTCMHDRFSQEIISQQVGKRPIAVTLRFNEQPSSDVADFLSLNGITVSRRLPERNTIEAIVKVDALCFLAEMPGIIAITATNT